MKPLLIVLFSLALICQDTSASQTVKSDVVASRTVLSGNSLKALIIASDVAAEFKLNLDNYNVKLLVNKNSYIVIFLHKETKRYQRGSSPKGIGVEVIISKPHLILLERNIIR